jgi:hypothetical protein
MSEEPLAVELPQRGNGGWLPAPARTPERQKLAAAIGAYAQARHRLEMIQAARERISLRDLEQARSEAADALAAVRAAGPRRLADTLLGNAPAETLPPIEEAARRHAIAEAALVEAQGARDILGEEAAEARTQLERAGESRGKAVAEVLRSAPEVLAVWQAYRAAHIQIEELAWTLHTIGLSRLPAIAKWDGICWPPERASGRPWAAAIAALAEDPDAELPE